MQLNQGTRNIAGPLHVASLRGTKAVNAKQVNSAAWKIDVNARPVKGLAIVE